MNDSTTDRTDHFILVHACAWGNEDYSPIQWNVSIIWSPLGPNLGLITEVTAIAIISLIRAVIRRLCQNGFSIEAHHSEETSYL